MSEVTAAVLTTKTRFRFSSRSLLNYAARFWFFLAAIGQLLFVFSVASIYGRAAIRGNLLPLDASMTQGYIPGQPIGNLVVAVHLTMAVLIITAGILQLIPYIRLRAPVFHRWNGRFYIVAAFTVSLAGLYMVWVRGPDGIGFQQVGISINGLLIMLCAAMLTVNAATI